MINRRDFTLALLAAAAGSSGCASARRTELAPDPLALNPERYIMQQIQLGDQHIAVRAFEGLPIVARPIEPEYQTINLYIPDAYFQGGSVGGYTAGTAPIFLPNGVGGYMPAKPGTLAARKAPPGQAAGPSASVVALSRGLIVAAPGARGRTLRASDGRWTGKAPAAIVDLKAAVRWLRHNADRIPGNMERMVANGTSAGGALAALLGASGNHPDYDAELQALGAAAERDDVYAVSAYCPITNLAHADEAYEWQFPGLREYRNVAITMLDFQVQRKEVVSQLSDTQLALSAQLRAAFVNYVNALGLSAPKGERLLLNTEGGGSLKDHIRSLLINAAQRAVDSGEDLSTSSFLGVRGGRVERLDFDAYVAAMGRMKALPAFDGLALETGENQLFGNSTTDLRHFTEFSARHSSVAGAARADAHTVRSMDAMQQLLDTRSEIAPHWRIRHGSADRDTSLAVPTLLAAAARQRQAKVDLAFPWGRPHSGDYDLDQLFDWVSQL